MLTKAEVTSVTCETWKHAQVSFSNCLRFDGPRLSGHPACQPLLELRCFLRASLKLQGCFWLSSEEMGARCPSAAAVLLILCLASPAFCFDFSLDTIKALFAPRRAPSPPAFPESFEVSSACADASQTAHAAQLMHVMVGSLIPCLTSSCSDPKDYGMSSSYFSASGAFNC